MSRSPPQGQSVKSLLLITAVFAVVSCCEIRAADMASKLFPFVVPGDDVSVGVTDLSFLNNRPADQLVTVRDGHFYAGDKRIRFWGMNSDYDANYPTHEQAEMLAKRFAKLGMNLLRITHTDQQYAPMGLFDPRFKGEMRLDPERLEKLDYFIAQLKKRGIYVELSLHIGHLRLMGKKGIPDVGDHRYSFGHGLPLWNARFIEAEKQYARDFFGHVNRYTGKPYTEEPAVAFVEIINENGILCAWPRGHLKKSWSDALVADLRTAWNVHLKRKYQTTDALRKAWAGDGTAAGTGLPRDESLEAANVAMPLTPADCKERSPQLARDFVDFLYEMDERYFTEMRDFLKHTLGCKHPIKGTQANSDYSSFFTQAKLDFLDVHGYWQHPQNIRDRKHWTINNLPMVNHYGSALVNLAFCRVLGKPFHVSEYCHPAPNTFCSEQIPTLSSFAAFQDWDGITLFTYAAHQPYTGEMIGSFFEHKSHPTKLVTMPFGALAFRRGDVATAKQEVSVGITLDDLKLQTIRGAKRETAAAEKGATWRDAFTHRLSVALGSKTAPKFQPTDQTVVVSDTEELTYDATKKDAAVLVVNSPRSKAVIGFGAGKTFDLGELVLKPGQTMQQGFSVITASVVSGSGFCSKGAKILLTATGYVENTGMGWNANKSSVGDQWGNSPVLCEGIPFELVLKTKSAKAWALDPRGQRAVEISPEETDGGIALKLGPQYKTLWYEVVIE